MEAKLDRPVERSNVSQASLSLTSPTYEYPAGHGNRHSRLAELRVESEQKIVAAEKSGGLF